MSDKEIIEAETVKENGNNPLKVMGINLKRKRQKIIL